MKTSMKILMTPVISLILSFAALPVCADGLKPLNNGALVEKDNTCFQGWVDVSGNSMPFFPNGNGLVVVPLERPGTSVTTPSGRLNLSCKGRIPFGEDAWAIDLISGKVIMATLATHPEACASSNAIWPDVCPGKQGPWFGSFDRVGVLCLSSDENGQTLATEDWLGLVTVSGQVTFNCHFDPVE